MTETGETDLLQTESAATTRKPVVLVVGMAGSGKTTFMQRLQADLTVSDKRPYLINLDPAVLDTLYEPNLDIRDTVDYKEVMGQYGLGPNGAIMTCLNLFATKWDQVLELLEKRSVDIDLTLIDTPGQIEVFTWSASGAIIADTVASIFPTVMAYIVDVERCAASPITFMSNMLYACSIMYRSRLPFCLVLNKTDICPADRILSWLRDYEAFQAALEEHQLRNPNTEYISGLMQSMGLVLDEFYASVRTVSLSAFTGDGMDGFMEALEEGISEYKAEYLTGLEKRRLERTLEGSLSNLKIA